MASTNETELVCVEGWHAFHEDGTRLIVERWSDGLLVAVVDDMNGNDIYGPRTLREDIDIVNECDADSLGHPWRMQQLLERGR